MNPIDFPIATLDFKIEKLTEESACELRVTVTTPQLTVAHAAFLAGSFTALLMRHGLKPQKISNNFTEAFS